MEVALHRRDTLGWATEVRVNDLKGDTENVKEGRFALDLDELSRLAAQRDEYARRLTKCPSGTTPCHGNSPTRERLPEPDRFGSV